MSDVLLDELRGRFRDTSRARVLAMAALLDELERNPADANALRQLGKHFHGLAGAGGTYGFPRVSELGDEAEGEILPMVRNAKAATAEQVVHWRDILRSIEQDLWSGGLQPVAVSVAPPAAAPFTVWLVQSDELLASRISEALEREEMRIRVLNCADAIAELEFAQPDAVIVDADSCDFLDQLHERDYRGGTIVTGESDFADKLRALRSGADAVIGKPLDIAALVRRVAALRERKEHPSRRILAVEDDATTGALLRGILGAAGYQVEICRDPAEFEQTLFAFAPDLLLMDVQLTDDLSGHDLVRYVRQSERFSTLPVIIVTSDSERRAIVEGTNAGADMLVTKPVDWDLLLAQIAARMERATVVRELTDRDPLTGVLTRGAFDARVRQRVQTGRPAVLALLDLDHFKKINDTEGHIAGDRVLAAFGTLLRRRLRQSDVVARYGGEEFALLIEDVDVPHAAELCERLLADFAASNHVTFSAGLAVLHESFDEAFRRADAALYEAKRTGRARVIAA